MNRRHDDKPLVPLVEAGIALLGWLAVWGTVFLAFDWMLRV